jgi:hypothetical protein
VNYGCGLPQGFLGLPTFASILLLHPTDCLGLLSASNASHVLFLHSSPCLPFPGDTFLLYYLVDCKYLILSEPFSNWARLDLILCVLCIAFTC